MIFEQFKQQLPDIDPQETMEWMEALEGVVEKGGLSRAQFLLYRLLKRARMLNIGLPPTVQTRYINTISPDPVNTASPDPDPVTFTHTRAHYHTGIPQS